MDLIDFSRYFAALLLVLGLLGGLAVILRRGWTPAGLGRISGWTSLNRQAPERRLGVRESMIIDPRRRVVIIRDGAREHVVLLGMSSETVLDTRPAPEAPVFTPVMPEAEAEPEDETGDATEDGAGEAPAEPGPPKARREAPL